MIVLQGFFRLVSAETFLIIVSMLMLIFGSLKRGIKHENTVRVAFVSFLLAASIVFFEGDFIDKSLSRFLFNDGLTAYFKILVLFAAMGNVILATEWLIIKRFKRFEYASFLMLSVVGMMIVISAKCFITLYLGLELFSLPLYLLVGFKRRAVRSTIMGARVLAFGILTSAIFLYGVSLIYGATGSLNFIEIAEFLSKNDRSFILTAGFFMFVAGLLFKSDVALFNFSSIDIAEGAPTPVTSFLLTAPKIACFAILIRLLNEVFEPFMTDFMPFIMFFALVSVLLGSIAMISQKNIKRLMAFCSMTYSGYMLMAFVGIEAHSIKPLLFLMLSYTIGIIGIFSIILSLRKNGNLIENIEDIKGFANSKPLTAIVFVFFMLSMAGFPPLAGFYSIFHLTSVLAKGEYYLSVIVIALSIVLMAVSFIKIIDIIYFKNTDDAFDDMRLYNKVVMVLGFALMLSFCVYPFKIVSFMETMVLSG